MPPVGEPVAAGIEERVNREYDTTSQISLHAVLHLCPNRSCSGAVVGYYESHHDGFRYRFHKPEWDAYRVSDTVPERPRHMLQSANDARHAPIACAAAAVKAVEAMMAEVGYKERALGLRGRIKKAVEDRKLPPLMADLANHVREIGNQTHTDEEPEPLTTQVDADQALKFANLLAEYLFVLPAEVEEAKALRKLLA
jgi:Domain of unknown function (DUF4145)